MKTIEDLVPDIYGLFAREEPFDVKLFRDFGDNLRYLMEYRFHTKRSGKSYLRMSNIGKPDRQLWYDLNSKSEKQVLPPATLVKFAYGDMIEQMILLYAKMAGHDVEHEQVKVELDGIQGHIDAVIDGVLVDVKSASSYSFLKFEKGSLFLPGNDPFGYVAQMCGYMEATGLERGGFLVVDKTLGKICFCEIPSDVVEGYNVRARVKHIKEVAESPTVPSRCYSDIPDGKSGNMKLDINCSYCPHKTHCWADANEGEGLKVFYYSGGPRWLTRVSREPKVTSFENA